MESRDLGAALITVHVLKKPTDIGPLAARRLQAAVGKNPAAFLGMATGSTPKVTNFWKCLRDLVGAKKLDLSRATFVNPDEWIGLESGHPETYKSYLHGVLTDYFPTNILVPDGSADDPVQAALEVESAIVSSGGFEWMLLGMGINGHIGFYEPNVEGLPSVAFLPAIAQKNRERYARDHFGSLEAVPTHATTIGLGTVMRSRELCLCVVGKAKAELLAGALQGPVTTNLPASLIQLHRHVNVFVDEDAASKLDLTALDQRIGWKVVRTAT